MKHRKYISYKNGEKEKFQYSMEQMEVAIYLKHAPLIMKLTHGLIVMCLIMCITHPPPPKKLQLLNNLTLQKDKTYLGSCDVEFSKLCLKVTVHLQLQKSLIKFYLHFEVFTQLFSNACIS